VPSLEASHADHRERVHQGGLGGILLGHGQVANPGGAGSAPSAARRSSGAPSREGELTDEPVAVDP